MSICDPIVDEPVGEPPPYQIILGMLTQTGTEPAAAPYKATNENAEAAGAVVGDIDPDVLEMWDVGCNYDNTYLQDDPSTSLADLQGDFHFYMLTDVECEIPPDNWEDVWKQSQIEAANSNPHSFMSSPIEWIKAELSDLIEDSVHWWLEVDDPFDAYGNYGAGLRSTSTIQETLAQSTVFIVGVVAVMSLLFVAGRMALRRDAGPARDMVRAMIVLVVVTAASMTIIKTLLIAGDRFSRYFIVKALHTVPGENVDSETGEIIPGAPGPSDPCTLVENTISDIAPQFENMNFFLFLLCSIFMLVAALVMYFYMLSRVFVITLLAGLLPLAAAGTATEAGRDWFGKMTSYIMAFILIKPAGTVVFVIALRLSDGQTVNASALEQLTATFFLFLGTVMLPAMTRIAFPFTAAAAGGDRGAKALAITPVAAGAKIVKSGVSRLRR